MAGIKSVCVLRWIHRRACRGICSGDVWIASVVGIYLRATFMAMAARGREDATPVWTSSRDCMHDTSWEKLFESALFCIASGSHWAPLSYKHK